MAREEERPVDRPLFGDPLEGRGHSPLEGGSRLRGAETFRVVLEFRHEQAEALLVRMAGVSKPDVFGGRRLDCSAAHDGRADGRSAVAGARYGDQAPARVVVAADRTSRSGRFADRSTVSYYDWSCPARHSGWLFSRPRHA